MSNHFLDKVDNLEKLPKKVKELLLALIKNFDACDLDDDYWDKQAELVEAFSNLCKYFLGNEQSYYYFLLTELEDNFLKFTGYNKRIALKYYNVLETIYFDILDNKKIDYSNFCDILRQFDRYFTAFKNQIAIPEELSMCIQILDRIFWCNDYEYADLKLKINRKIRLILGQYDHAYLSTFPDEMFDDEEYADDYDDNLIFDDLFSGNNIFNDDIKGCYIYLSCCFDKELEGKTYYYRTNDDSIELEEEIIVPYGSNNNERHAWVANKEYFFAECVPFPVEKTKKVLRKANGKLNPEIELSEEVYEELLSLFKNSKK